MSILFILIIISLLLALGFLFAFFWATKNGQFDDDYTPSVRILFDDDPPPENDDEVEDKKAENSEKPDENIGLH